MPTTTPEIDAAVSALLAIVERARREKEENPHGKQTCSPA
ncbi:hypothetical protein DFW101_3567 [Solidesulfovibrio carbinoliphilus subsp. oakridgensis]|uniref:Uncharacterized protein n=1 Tax=Solidesulfovibrio carbinoliphilus subsp. oakridgensis TaxID=694327 RepID=G7Q5K4_9BACT|nr:hypothetical protein DFW101_3567 [Solidesulfovibrio carbinoliphilus subsp. oakridgensis]